MKTTDTRFSKAQVVVHWLTLLLLLGSFFSHDAMESAYEALTQSDAANFSPALGVQVHVIIGISVLVLTLIRIFLKVTKGAPAPVEGQHPLITIASASVHGLLYLVLLAMPLTGMAAWFGMITAVGEVHGVLFGITLALVAAHVLAALFHQFIIKDNLLARMTFRG